MKNIYNSWTLFDCDGNSISGEEDTVRLHFGKTCRVCATDRSTTADSRLELAMSLSGARLEKVATIRAAIANGTYHVSSADLAQKLIHTMFGDFQ